MPRESEFDLLRLSQFLEGHHIHQLKQTNSADSATQIVIRKVLQNAIGAVVLASSPRGRIEIDLNFDTRQVRVRDSGNGFPNDPKLLFLDGTK